MSRKLIVVGLAVVLVVALAVPVVAQDRMVSPRVQGLSKKALKQARKALRVANAAKRQSAAATTTAGNAAGAADAARALASGAGAAAAEAKASAAETQAMVDSTRVRSAVAAAGESTTSSTFVTLPGGPSVGVEVPPSGLIEVWAQATIDGEGAVALFEDGVPLDGQASFCSPGETGVLLGVVATVGEPTTVSTPAAFGVGFCGTLGAPGPVLFQTTPGSHSYELRYASCGCEDAAEPVQFSDRRLFVAPRR